MKQFFLILIFPVWFVAWLLIYIGSAVAFAGQWIVILIETASSLPEMPEYEKPREGAEL